ncbi:MAG: SDR family NAD(P)-dependent oxidoreductase [Moorea sp. SIOASIH]|uniref:type I polyketide synthase n=1 Tax=Moorena sp. SIOASIH TaxID=2607817 RepID=UPI0013B8472A|nr:type I polyketide synthase [Moorena sp. SIOASIH]NEO35907.1 SDR family NAD(P)-dependent oxidoreductase [Moorena sp. SIOASIH]
MKQINQENESLASSKRLLFALKQARTQLEELQRQKSEPIAIVGMGCRFPGGVKDPGSFWQLLKNGVDSITEIPGERWDIKDYYHPDPDVPGKMYTRYGGFLEEVDQFEPQFFGISPREATAMDPQQRLLLEVSWEALEHAGLAPDQLQGSQTGAFMGICFEDYSRFSVNSGDPTRMDAYSSLGNTRSIAAGRLAYIFGFNGPTFFLDTSCSSSLLSVHLACQSLRYRECNLALAGGVNLILTPEATIGFCKLKALSTDGRCKTFDASADGYGRGEGCGILVLKRLSNAIADGDQIFALIRGSAVNHDGKSNGLTAPNGSAQEALLQQALENSRVTPSQIQYVEAHGTGTSLGDPIEVLALGKVLGQGRAQDQPLKIGSVKTNFGHLEAAAGVAGLIKVVLGLQHQQIPPHLHLKEPNPHIPWQKLPITVPTELTPWESGEKGRLAGVSSFGMSGTNVHIILEEAPGQGKSEELSERTHHILTLSAKSEKALLQLVQSYQKFLGNNSTAAIADICFTANTGRSHFTHRLAILTSDQQDLADKLAKISAKEEASSVLSGQLSSNNKSPKIAFLFTGQGSQDINMGRQLYETQPVFRQTLDQCEQILKTYLEKSILDVIYPENTKELNSALIDQTAYTQPALFAIEYALFQLWKSWGIKPDVVMGHSVGEYVAACVAGVFSLEDGLKLIAHRGRLMQQLPSGGEMVAVMASKEKVNQLIAPYADKVAIAAINGPVSTVVSGAAEPIKTVRDSLEAEGIKTKQLQVSHAFHSPLMEPMLAEFEAIASEITYNKPTIPLISNLTGTTADDSITTASYWVNHVRQPVKFAQSMETLHQLGYDVFLEIGSKAILLGMGRQCLPEGVGVWLPSLRPAQEDWQQMLHSLAQLYVQGFKVDWLGFDRDYSRSKVVLPTYPFQRQRYWVKSTQPFLGNGSDQAQTDIVNLLNNGNTKELAERVVQSNGFTDDQLQAINRALDILTKQHQQQLQSKSNVAQDYYNALASLNSGLAQDESVQPDEERFLTFGPFPQVLPGFSWSKVFSSPKSNPEYVELIRRVQKEMRDVLFAHVDFSVCESALDFGCGYGSDLISLAKKYPHLRLHGYTISKQQAQVGAEKVQAHQLQQKVQIFNRDSATDQYPDNYDLVFGFEVAHHVFNKKALFSNIGLHLNEQGYLVLADFISNAEFAIQHHESSSFFITKDEWVEHLSSNQLQVIECIDTSYEIANFLDDANFEENLEAIYQSNRNENILAAFQSYNQLGGLLRKGLASYILLTTKKQSQLSEDELRQWNRSQLQKLVPYSLRSPQHWLYELAWKPLPSVPEFSTPESDTGQWLIFADQKGVGEELATELEQQGKTSILVYRGEACEQISVKQWRLRLREPADYLQVSQTLADGQTWEGVVHLWSLDSKEPVELTVSSLQECQQLGCGSVLHLVQALNQLAESHSSPGLWLITQGSQAVEKQSNLVQVQQSPLWGLGRVITLEYPQLNCRLLDLDLNEGVISNTQVLVKEMLRPDGENQLAYRQAQRYGARLKRFWDPTGEDTLPVKETGSYLITGGLGALGLEVAQWLVEKGAQHLVLTSRRKPNQEAQRVLDQMHHLGVNIKVVQADVARSDDVARLLVETQESMRSLRGIIHAAGVLDDGVLIEQSWERFEKVMLPKVAGSWNLHQLSKHLPLDFFVCFSSVASLLGSPGQGNYAAANAFMDGLVYHRRAMGLPGLSINWGPWSTAGMAVNLDSRYQNRMVAMGISHLTSEQGLEILGQLLEQSLPQVGVLPVEWSVFQEQFSFGNQMPLLSELLITESESTKTKEPELLERLESASECDRQNILITHIQTEVAQVLGLDSSDLLDPDRGFVDMGMDSLMALELKNRLQNNLGIPLAATLAIEYSTIQTLSKYLAEEVMGWRLPEKNDMNLPKIEKEQGNALSEVKQIAEDDVESLIAKEVEELKTLLGGSH